MKLNAAMIALAVAGLLCAQPQPRQEKDVMILRGDAGAVGFGVAAGGPMEMSFVASEFSWTSKIVKNAPYSADAVTETTQTLADGNRIQRKSSSVVARDGEGRTRREHTIEAVGPWAGRAHKTVFINDPVAGVNWVLEPEGKTARKVTMPKAGELHDRVRIERAPAGAMRRVPPPGGGVAVIAEGGNVIVERVERRRAPGDEGQRDNVRNESLGEQVIEGVPAKGTRTTLTIPAGQIGNDRPIDVISERWYSSELETEVMTRRLDPRTGETVFRLANLRRGEPGRQLFEPPADYSVKEEAIHGPAMRFERKIEHK